jgi:hypothetical protein
LSAHGQPGSGTCRIISGMGCIVAMGRLHSQSQWPSRRLQASSMQ